MATAHTPAFKLKAHATILSTFYLLNDDINQLQAQLHTSMQQAPNFFKQTPVVIDLSHLHPKEDQATDLQTLCTVLRQYGMIPIAIQNAGTYSETLKDELEIALLSQPLSSSKVTTHTPSSSTKIAESNNQIITQTVRSGQSIYARHKDLIVLAAVSHGAELLADGHIHVYGTLRGRALAGVSGDKQARIFCHCLEAQLVAIAGIYQLNEQFPSTLKPTCTQIYLTQQEYLTFSNL